MERLEDRTTPAVFTVTNTTEAAGGSFADAIAQANGTPGFDQIHFNIPGAGVQTIGLTGSLPPITDSVLIDGYTQPGASPNTLAVGSTAVLLIQISQSGSTAGVTCLSLAANDTTVRGLVINNFTGHAIVSSGANNVVTGNFLGINPAGTTIVGGGGHGVFISGSGNRVGTDGDGVGDAGERNVITGFVAGDHAGVSIIGANNAVAGNYIGVNASGNGFGTGLPSNFYGIDVHGGATNTRIGTDGSNDAFNANERNVIVEANSFGIYVRDPGTGNTVIAGNYIGISASGAANPVNITASGVSVGEGAADIRIGTNGDGVEDAAERNVIGNVFTGIQIGSTNTVVAGNFIGTDPTGTASRPITFDGVGISGGVGAGVRIGTNGDGVGDAAERNVIASCAGSGVQILVAPPGVVVAGNYIGTDVTGAAALPNGVGVEIGIGSTGARIGTDGNGVGDIAERNVISGNTQEGVTISGLGLGASGHVVAGNYIGTDATGLLDLGNGGKGVLISSAKNNVVGGPTAAFANLIAGNQSTGVYITGPEAIGNTVSANTIGLNAVGDIEPNDFGGVVLDSGANSNTIGGPTPAYRNVISGNSFNGVLISGISANFNDVRFNYIGTDPTGLIAQPNAASGVFIGAADGNEVFDNVISGNGIDGVDVTENSAENNLVYRNVIGLGSDGDTALGNGGYGVAITGAANTRIGTGVAGQGNVISANGLGGVVVAGSGPDQALGNQILGNLIGTDATGLHDRGNLSDGVRIDQRSNGTIVGDETAAEPNVISGNRGSGVRVTSAFSVNSMIVGNYIGLGKDGDRAVGNTKDGVQVDGGTSSVTIGGPLLGEGNVISANGQFGVWVDGVGTSGVSIRGNFIGTDKTGTADRGNASSGVVISESNSATVGGSTAPQQRNLISGNGGAGVQIEADGIIVQGNSIGTDVTGLAALGNDGAGVQLGGFVAGANNNIIGGLLPGLPNVISGNLFAGVFVGSVIFPSSNNSVTGNLIGLGKDGATKVGNATAGVHVTNAGGTTVEGNSIGGNAGDGVVVNLATGTVLVGNRIGLDATGTAAVGNTGSGVKVENGAVNTTIGFPGPLGRNVISGNAGTGVLVTGPGTSGTLIQNNHIGSNAAGAAALGNGAGGVSIAGGASNNTVGGGSVGARNVISGHATATGVLLTDAGTTGNKVQGNFIGTNATGTAALGNLIGVWFYANASGNVAGVDGDGASDALEGNVISGNTGTGVYFQSNADSNVVAGNLIGLDANGTAALPNVQGIRVFEDLTTNNVRIGTNADGVSDALERNVISANTAVNVWLAGSLGAVVAGNYIGTNASGTAVVGTSPSGIIVNSGGNGNRIGTNADGVNDTAERNVISGHTGHGVTIADAATFGNVVAGNFIGTDATGTAGLGNQSYGLSVSSPGNLIGGTTAAARNVISANGFGFGVGGVALGGSGNTFQGNYVGTDVSGAIALGNAFAGIAVTGANHLIGGAVPGAGNLISGNGGDGGISFRTSPAPGNVVQGNRIGTDASGNAALGNAFGIVIFTDGVSIIGNLISGNNSVGVLIQSGSGNVIRGNLIGTNAAGGSALGNGTDGVSLIGSATGNRVGGATPADRNVISGNTENGVAIVGASGNRVQGNYIGVDVSGNVGLGNGGLVPGPGGFSGVVISGAPNNFVGTDGDGVGDAGEGNVISANSDSGVEITGAGATGNVVAGNIIGLGADGSTPLGHVEGFGVNIALDAGGNRVGTDGNTVSDLLERNVLSENLTGVAIQFTAATGNVVAGNLIGTDKTGLLPRGNRASGVTIAFASGNRVGTDGNGVADAAERNVIAATDLIATGPNFGHGVLVVGTGTTNNAVAGNFIGTDVSGKQPLGNAGSGVMVFSGPTTTSVGGAAVALANVIAFNLGAGVTVQAGANPVAGTTVRLNSIFANYGLGIDLGGDHAVTINDTGDTDAGANGLLNFPVIASATVVGSDLVVQGFAPNGRTVELYATDTTPDASGFGQGRTFLGTVVVSSPLTGTYGPKPFQGVLLGTDTTNMFSVTVPLPAGFNSLARVTSTAWDGSNSSEFGNNVPVQIAALTLGVSPQTISEGGEITLSGVFPVADPTHTRTVLIHWGDGSSETLPVRAGVAGFTAPHRYMDDNAADSYPIAVRVTDDVTGFAFFGTAAAAVTNVAPTVRIVHSGTNADGTQVTLTADVADPGTPDVPAMSYEWTIDSNGTATTFTGKSFTFTRTLATNSVISVQVSDGDGGSDTDTIAVRTLTPGDDKLDGAAALTDADVPTGADRLVVLALAGNDFINASAMTRPVELVGDFGDDTLTAGSGADILDDGHGDDLLRGNAGDDVYRLIPGSDDVISELTDGATGSDSGGRDRVDFSRAELDTVTGNGIKFRLDQSGTSQTVSTGNTVTAYGDFEDLVGSDHKDELTGNELGNQIYGGTGADTISAADGDDVIFGGRPPGDTIGAADGDDVIYGGLGNDTISADAGDDVIYGGRALGDTIASADGDDVIFGGTGADTISAGDGDDVVYGGRAPGDTIGAADGDDVIFGGTGSDTISASDGNDVIYGGRALGDTIASADGDDVIYGGLGNDTISADAGDDVVYGGRLSGDTIGSGDDNDVIFGGTGSDTISASDGNDVIYGGRALGDTIASADGDDVIYGGLGNDTISADAGDDVVYGGRLSGDTIGSGDDNDVIFGGTGSDTISASDGNDVIFGGRPLVDTIASTDGDDVVYGGRALGDTIASEDGDDVIFGGLGNDTITADAGDDVVYGGRAPEDTIAAEDGNDVIYGGAGSDTVVADAGNDVVYGGDDADLLEVVDDADLTAAAGNIAGGQVVGGGRTTTFAEVERVALTGGPAANRLDATGLNLPAILTGAGGNDTLLGGSQGDELAGGAGDDSLAGGSGDDVYLFAGGTLGSDTLDELPGNGTDALDFRRFAGPVTLNLSLTGAQVVHPTHLTLALTFGLGVENVFGSTYSDTLTGNALPNALVGGGGRDVIAGDAGGDTLQGNVTQVVYLDFDTETGPGDHLYTPAERQAIRDRIAADFALFNFDVTLARPAGGTYVTLFFNEQPLPGRSEVFGLAEELDWRNQRLGGSAAIDVNFLGRVPATDNAQSFIAVSATIGAHELGHLLGLRHWDAFALIGEGIFAATDASRWLPVYTGPKGAIQTPHDLMASPRSVGVSEIDALGDPHLGQRSAVKLAFADTGTVAFEQSGAHQAAATPQSLTLAGLAVPNTLPGRVGTFAVSALAVAGRIELSGGVAESDFYSFFGTAGALMNFEIMSESLAGNDDVVDTILRIRGPGGQVIYENDDGFEPTDSIILDLILPATGVYTIEVDTYTSDLVPDTDAGWYELFLYTFAAGPSLGQGDRLEGGTGDDVLIGSSGADTYVFSGSNLGSDTVVAITDNGEGVLDFSGLLGGATVDLSLTDRQEVNPNLNLTLLNKRGIRTVIGTPLDDVFSGDEFDNAFVGGGGTDRVVQAGGSAALTTDTLIGAGTDRLFGIEEVVLTGSQVADVLSVSGWTGTAVLDGAGGSDDYTITFNGSAGQVVVKDGGTTGTDRLFVNATAGPDLVVIHTESVDRGAESVGFDSTTELVTVDGLTGTNTAQFVEPAPAVPLVLINFGAPAVALTGAAAVNEGSLYTLALGAITNAVPSTASAYTIDWGDGVVETILGSPMPDTQRTHTYLDGTNAARTVTVSLTIAGSPVAAGSLSVVVNNVVPLVGAIAAPLEPVVVATSVTATATFSDPAGGLDAAYTVTWNWGDGATDTDTVAAGVYNLSRDHTYAAAGVYTITLTVADKDGGAGQSLFQYVVVYNPAAGSMTGGGWIDSPTGAYPADPTLTSKGHFGFNARYQSGASVPTGKTNFHLGQSGLKFQSTGYDWMALSVAGARLQGSGQIDGAGNYGFFLSVIDGGAAGGGGVDRFRIRIWDKTTGDIVYDNQFGAADSSDPVTPVGGGNVKIQGGPNPLQVRSGPVAGGEPLAADRLAPLVQEAIARWAAAGADPDSVAALGRAAIYVIDLPDGYLGLAGTDAILVDLDAAGLGWFVDPTPEEDSEFRLPGDQGEQGRIDLLTVILHEFGHLIGHDHEEEGAMEERLAPGQRLLPAHDHEPAVTPSVAATTPARLPAPKAVFWAGEAPAEPEDHRAGQEPSLRGDTSGQGMRPSILTAVDRTPTSGTTVTPRRGGMIAPLGPDQPDGDGHTLPPAEPRSPCRVVPALADLSDDLAVVAQPSRVGTRPTEGRRHLPEAAGRLAPDDWPSEGNGVWVG